MIWKIFIVIACAFLVEQVMVYDALVDFFPVWFRVLFALSYVIVAILSFILMHDEKRKKLFEILQFLTLTVGLALCMAAIHWVIIVS